jgi:hypothetical protein
MPRAKKGLVSCVYFYSLELNDVILIYDLQTGANASLFSAYDLIALVPTTEAAFSYAVLTHTLPSNLTAHIISIPLTLPRLPFRMKHTLVRSALRNGAVFEINYAGALGVDEDDAVTGGSSSANNANASVKGIGGPLPVKSRG